MRANRRQSLAELCNPKLVRLAQVPHRTADREDPKLIRRKWQPPHNMGKPHTVRHTRQIHLNIETVQMDNFTVRVKLSEAGGYNSIEFNGQRSNQSATSAAFHKMSRRIDVTSAAVFLLRGRRTINFVRWSWYTSKKLYGSFIARLTCMSMRSTCPLDAKSELRMGLVTVLFRDFLDF